MGFSTISATIRCIASWSHIRTYERTFTYPHNILGGEFNFGIPTGVFPKRRVALLI
jgi:hypothetical protein